MAVVLLSTVTTTYTHIHWDIRTVHYEEKSNLKKLVVFDKTKGIIIVVEGEGKCWTPI